MKKIISVCAMILCMFGVARASESPRVYMEREGAFGLKILVDSDRPVNAYNIRITYDPSVVEVEVLDTSRSLVTIAPKPMTARGGEILIKGGSTSSFAGTGGELARVVLRPVGVGVGTFELAESFVYQADGSGAATAIAGKSFSLRVTSGSFSAYGEAREVLAFAPVDAAPPRILTTQIEKNPFRTEENLLVFMASDLESGISRYEAREREWVSWSKWREAFNPYPLESGAWAVQLKAVDNGGNSSLATVYQMGPAAAKFGVLAGALAMLYLVFRFVRRRSSPQR